MDEIFLLLFINFSHENLDEESTLFGKKSQVNSCNVRSLLQDITTPCSHADIDVAMNEAIGYIRRLRRNIYKCRDFHIHDLKQLLRKSDKDSTGFITLPKLFHVLDSLLIRTNEKRIRKVMSLFKILLDEGQPNERVNIELFWKMLHIQHPLPAINTKSNANGLVQETTTYKEFCKDRDKS